MANLIPLIPDIDVLISLAPEELAEVVLQLAFENKQNNNAHLQTIMESSPGYAARRGRNGILVER